MDLLASRLAGDAKMKAKSKKGVKRLSKNDSKGSKQISISKIDSEAIEKPLKERIKNNLAKISSKKKELIKNTLVGVKKFKMANSSEEIVKNISKKKKNVVVNNPIVLPKTIEPKPTKNTKKSKEIPKNNINLLPISKSKKGQKSLFEELNISKKKKVKSAESKAFKIDSVKENVKLSQEPKKSKAMKTNKELNISKKKKVKLAESKVIKVDSVKENVKLSQESKKSKALKTNKAEALKENESPDLKSKKRKVTTSTLEEDSSNVKLSKKLKNQPVKADKVDDNVEIKNIKSKKRKEHVKEEIPEYLEGKNLTRKEIKKYVVALFKVVESEEQRRKSLFSSDKPPIFLQITCIKVPKTPLHQTRITLPHSMISATDDVALFTKDLKKGRRRDYENTVHYYEDLLQRHGVTRVKTIIPINQVKTEYRQFEMRRRLSSTYDYFLVDGRISGHMAHLLGKEFRLKRKLPTSIHMDRKDLKSEINEALKKTILEIHSNGDSSTAQVGTFSMDIDKIVDNIVAVLQDLHKNYPGGWENIRSLRIKTPLSLAIPIYVSLKSRDKVKVPVLEPRRPKAYRAVEGDLSTFTSNVKVTVAPDGSVNVQKLGNDSGDEDSNESEDDCFEKDRKVKNETGELDKEEDDDEN